MAGWNHANAKWEPKKCVTCEAEFLPKSGASKFCSLPCKRKYARTYGAESTQRQYELISGNWEKYFGRLCLKSLRRDKITKDDCLTLLKKQNYKCALTGVALTCKLEKGVRCRTNASIDRIDPRGEYAVNNIQLVCAAVNVLRVDMSVEEFISWCKKVTNYAIQR